MELKWNKQNNGFSGRKQHGWEDGVCPSLSGGERELKLRDLGDKQRHKDIWLYNEGICEGAASLITSTTSITVYLLHINAVTAEGTQDNKKLVYFPVCPPTKF